MANYTEPCYPTGMGRYISPKPLKEGREKARESEQRYAQANEEARRASSRERQRKRRLDPVLREKFRKEAAEHRLKYPRHFLNSLLKSRYGITLDEYEALEQRQEGVCAVCSLPETHKSGINSKMRSRLSVDHCHAKNVVRGLLCSRCNTGLGKFRSSPHHLTRAVTYLAQPAPSIPDTEVRPETPSDRRRDKNLRKLGINLAQYRVLEVKQGQRCAICEEQETAKGNNGEIKHLAVDHCHASNMVRGLLCQACNQGLGMFLHGPLLLLKAVRYLEAFRE